MKLIDLRKQLKEYFLHSGIEQNDADYIIAECLGVKPTDLIFIKDVNLKQLKQIKKCAKLRLKHMPVNKIFKRAYFYGNWFNVNRNVLSPRQDSEVVVQTAIDIINKNKFNSVLDLCTGSGCLAITISKNTNVEVCASDISSGALKVARLNAKQCNVDIKFIKSNMFKKIKKKFDLIISNPPYIETETIKSLEKEVKKFDPMLALDGGIDGLSYYTIFKEKANEFLNDGGFLVLEIGYNQKDAIKKLFNNFKFVECIKDLGQNDRVMVFQKLSKYN